MLLILSSGLVAVVVLVAVFIWWYYYKRGTTPGGLGGGDGRVRAPVRGRPLPQPKGVKDTPPWNIMSLYQSQHMTFDADKLTLRYEAGRVGSKSGGGFHANPFGLLPADACTLEYSVYFPANFDFNKGGKLPGLCFGTPSDDCATGGDWSADGGSFRTVFREGGLCVANLYLALGSSDAALNAQSAEYNRLVDKTGGGHLLWHTSGTLKFIRGAWNTVRMRLVLNTPGARNGVVELSLNGTTRTLTGVVLRRTANTKIRTVSIHSFFGGHSQDWAAPPNMSIGLRNFAFS
jgi:hypothetical protein